MPILQQRDKQRQTQRGMSNYRGNRKFSMVLRSNAAIPQSKRKSNVTEDGSTTSRALQDISSTPTPDPMDNTHSAIAEEINFIHLNDDCIFAIFNFVQLSELTAMSATCSRLQCLAQQHFALKYKDHLCTLNGKGPEIIHFLRTFGPHMSSLCLNQPWRPAGRKKKDRRFLSLLYRYCRSLMSLELNCFDLKCEITCPEHRSYYSYAVDRASGRTEQIACESFIVNARVRKLFSRLTKLSLYNCAFDGRGLSLETLNGLTLRMYHCSDSFSLGRLRGLEKLRISVDMFGSPSHIVDLLNEAVGSLRYLDIIFPEWGWKEICRSISQMIELETLCSTTCSQYAKADEVLVKMCSELANLSELTIGYYCRMDLYQVRRIVERCPKLERVILISYCISTYSAGLIAPINVDNSMEHALMSFRNQQFVHITIIGDDEQCATFYIPDSTRSAGMEVSFIPLKTVAEILGIKVYSGFESERLNELRMTPQNIQKLRDHNLPI